jgi:Skp family chaperone for outer membrane proteins
MRHTLITVVVTSVVTVCCCRMVERVDWLGAAQAKESTARPKREKHQATRVGVIDIAALFKKSSKVASFTKALQADIAVAEEKVQQQRAELQQMAAPAEKMAKDSQEYKALEAEFKKRSEELAAAIAEQKKGFVDRQAQGYLEAYEEIVAATEQYSRQKGIQLVLRVSTEPYDRSNSEEVFREFNKTVIYYEELNITDDVMKTLNGE